MPDRPVSELTEMAAGNLAALDDLYVRDDSEAIAADQNKRISPPALQYYMSRISSDKLLIVDNSSTPIAGPDYTTITSALAAAGDGDVVMLMPGRYYEKNLVVPDNVLLTQITQNIHFQFQLNHATYDNGIFPPIATTMGDGEFLIQLSGSNSRVSNLYLNMLPVTSYGGTVSSFAGTVSALTGVGEAMNTYIYAAGNNAATIAAIKPTGILTFHNGRVESGTLSGSAHNVLIDTAATSIGFYQTIMTAGASVTSLFKKSASTQTSTFYHSHIRNTGATVLADIAAGGTLRFDETHIPAAFTTVNAGAGSVVELNHASASEITAGTVAYARSWSPADIVSAIDQHVDATNVDWSGLPTSDPAVVGAVWNDAGTVKISSG